MEIELRDVSFTYGYGENAQTILSHLNLSVAATENVGIIGESGSGKSTLLKLLSGLYSIQTGSICVAGETNPEQIRKRVSMVLQSAALFPISIRENITCGHDVSEEAIRTACEAAQIAEWIDSLPEGLDTFVGERGGKVSGGQAQRICIARAILKDAPVILLDEATSALDEKTGQALLAALSRLTSGKTVVNISHRKEALQSCTVIYRLREGSLEQL